MNKLCNFFKENNLRLEHKRILVASSAGPDSMALLDMMRCLLTDTKNLYVAHLDHQLRTDSYLESQVLQEYCQKYDLMLFETKWPYKEHPKTGIEAAARNYRYQFLKQVVNQQKIDYVLTAHHGDDLLENILLKLIRSGNVKEMNSLQPVATLGRAQLLRPLLNFSKQELLQYDQQRQIHFIEDTTNDEDDTLRNRLRHHVVPLLKQENPEILNNADRFLRTENSLARNETTFFENLPQGDENNGLLTGELSALTSLDLKQKLAFFSWQIARKWQQHVYFSATEFAENKLLQKDGYGLLLYQNHYFLGPTDVFQLQGQTMSRIELDQVFNFNKRQLMVSQRKLTTGWQLIGTFAAPEKMLLQAGSPFAGMRLLAKDGQHIKPKKKFAQAEIPQQLRNACLVLQGQDQIYFVEKTYKNQLSTAQDTTYYVYQKAEE